MPPPPLLSSSLFGSTMDDTMALEQASSPGRCRCSEAFARALLAGQHLPDQPPPEGASSVVGDAGLSFEGGGAYRASPAAAVLPIGDGTSDWLDDPKPSGPEPGAKSGGGISGANRGRSDSAFTGQPAGFSAGGFWLVEAEPLPALACGPRTFWLSAHPAKVSRSALTRNSLTSLEGGVSAPQAPTGTLATGDRDCGSAGVRLPAPTPALLDLASLRAVQLAVLASTGNVSAKLGETARVSGEWRGLVAPPLTLPEADCCELSLGGPLGGAACTTPATGMGCSAID